MSKKTNIPESKERIVSYLLSLSLSSWVVLIIIKKLITICKFTLVKKIISRIKKKQVRKKTYQRLKTLMCLKPLLFVLLIHLVLIIVVVVLAVVVMVEVAVVVLVVVCGGDVAVMLVMAALL